MTLRAGVERLERQVAPKRKKKRVLVMTTQYEDGAGNILSRHEGDEPREEGVIVDRLLLRVIYTKPLTPAGATASPSMDVPTEAPPELADVADKDIEEMSEAEMEAEIERIEAAIEAAKREGK